MSNRFRGKTSRVLALVLGAFMLAAAGCSSPEEEAQAHFEKGLELLNADQPAKARLEFLNALQLNDKLTSAWFNLAKVEELNSKWPAVFSNLTRVLELDPDHFEAHLRLARLNLSARKLDKALEHINRAAALKSDHAGVFASKAGILLQLKDREGARRDAQRALDLEASNADALSVLAAERMLDEDLDGALAFVNRGLKSNSDNLALLLFSMRIHERQNNYDEVESILRRLLVKNPDNKRFRQVLVALLLKVDRKEDAKSEMRKLVSAFPDDNESALRLVGLIQSLETKDAARSELTKLLEERPDQIELKLALARFDFGHKGLVAARAVLDPIIQNNETAVHARRARLELAKLLIASKRRGDALQLVEEVLSSDERNSDALGIRASLRIDDSDLDNAISDLREALSQEPESILLLQLLGRAFERKGSLELAQERYAQAARLSNFDPRVTIRFVEFLRARRKNELVESTLTEAVTRQPNSVQMLRMLGQARLQKQDWIGAQQVAARLSQLGDKGSISDELRANALLGLRKFDESIASFESAVNKNPNSVRPLFSLVAIYLKSGKLDEAEKLVQSVLAANDKNAEAHVLFGAIKAQQKKLVEVVAAYKRAIESQPEKAIGYIALGTHYARDRKLDEARKVFEQGFEKAPGSLRLTLALAGHLQIRGDIDGAIDVYDRHLKSAGGRTSPIVSNNLASLLSDYRDDQESLDRAAELVKTLNRVELPQFKDTIGWIAYKRGEYKEAATYLEDAVAKLPKLAFARYHLGLTYVALKRPADAKEQLQKAAELNKDQSPLKDLIAKALSNIPASEAPE